MSVFHLSLGFGVGRLGFESRDERGGVSGLRVLDTVESPRGDYLKTYNGSVSQYFNLVSNL